MCESSLILTGHVPTTDKEQFSLKLIKGLVCPHSRRNTILRNATQGFLYILLTVHLGSFLVNNQIGAQFFFHIYLFQFSTCFEHPCAHHQENQLY